MVLVYDLTTKIISIQSAIIQFNFQKIYFLCYFLWFILKKAGQELQNNWKKKKYETEIGIKAKQNIFCEYYEKYLS